MDVNKLRADFPLLTHRKINDKPIVYFDSACVTLTPQQVIDAMRDYYYHTNACAGRSVHTLGAETTKTCEMIRNKVRAYINARETDEIIFTSNTTEGINLVARGLNLRAGDTVITTDREHNSNLIVWQMLRKTRRISHRIVHFRVEDDTFAIENLESIMNKRVKLISVFHTSNINGYMLPIREITKLAHDYDALVLLDAAQSAGHRIIDVQRLDIDFLCFSFHKMLGPTLGVLYGKRQLLDTLQPYVVGGGTVTNTTYTSAEFITGHSKFEPGLQNYAAIYGAGAAIDYIERVGRANIQEHESSLNTYITTKLKSIPELSILGPQNPRLRAGIFSFNIRNLDSHDVALYLDNFANIMVRSGMHCVHSWFNARRINGCVRVSFYLYNTLQEVDLLIEGIESIIEDL
jgi:cysteine desulfurase/selenocysteine lyase